MKFDSNLAWRQASAGVAANRDVLLALAGVFYLLPGLFLALFFPQPEAQPSASEEQMMAMVSEYYLGILPVAIPILLLQFAGTLSILTFFTDRSRPTVAQAIRLGLRGFLAYVGAQMALGFGIGLIGGLILTVGAATGAAALTAVALAAVIAVFVYVMVRASLVGPVIAVENERNPFAALKRSWTLSQGNTARIGLFYMLVLIAFLVVIMIISLLIGIVVALLAGPEAAKLAGAVIGSLLNAIMALYFVAIIAAVHRQLAGPSPGAQKATFE